MKNLRNNISYKLYSNGEQFIKENETYLHKSKERSIETAFFFLNAKNYHQLDQKNYAFQFKSGEEVLLILRLAPYNMLLFGAKSLCEFAANCLADYNLEVEHILGEQEVTLEFLKHYQKRKGGNILLEHSMQIMVLNQLLYFTEDEVFKCSEKDLDVLAECYSIFQKEIFHNDMSILEAKTMIQGNEHNFYAYKVKDKIVSIASKTREDHQICAISHVFTKPEYRGKGYAKQVVSKISKDILDEGKMPYLYVDSINPISNHIYLNLGFTYLNSYQTQYFYKPTTMKKAILAGGCFWCMAEPFYSCLGVKKVISGFVGGLKINPSYAEVKQGDTHHKEAILIEYDSTKLVYSSLLDIYFSSIDPFDAGGQFIDRGENYTCGIFTSDLTEKEEVLRRIDSLEKEYGRKVYVAVCEDMIFYPAEEEHQDYALKYPDKMKEELEVSGRIKKGEN